MAGIFPRRRETLWYLKRDHGQRKAAMANRTVSGEVGGGRRGGQGPRRPLHVPASRRKNRSYTSLSVLLWYTDATRGRPGPSAPPLRPACLRRPHFHQLLHERLALSVEVCDKPHRAANERGPVLLLCPFRTRRSSVPSAQGRGCRPPWRPPPEEIAAIGLLADSSAESTPAG